MNRIARVSKIATLLMLSVFLWGCNGEEYEDQINDMKIEHVYLPPTTAYYPYTLLAYTKKSGYTSACSAVYVLGKSTLDEVKSSVTSNGIAEITVAKSSVKEYEIKLDADDKGKLEAKYRDIAKIKLILKNGNQFEFPLIHYSEAKKNIVRNCGKDIQERYKDHPDEKYFLPTVVYGYDMDYQLFSQNGTQITGEVPKEVLKVVSAKIGINVDNQQELMMKGNNMFIGFNGTPIPPTIADNIDSGFISIQGADQTPDDDNLQEKVKKKPEVYDMTEELRILLMPQN